MNDPVIDFGRDDEAAAAIRHLSADPVVSSSNRKQQLGQGGELVELLWRNGNVVMHTQTHRKPPPPPPQDTPPKPAVAPAGVSVFFGEDAAWREHDLLDHLLGKDFLADWYTDMADADGAALDEKTKGHSGVAYLPDALLQPKHTGELVTASIGSSVCLHPEKVAATPDTASLLTSGPDARRIRSVVTGSGKRKAADRLEESESNCGATKPAARRVTAFSRRSRDAEVHNLSERRRRDRINEKMKALQELIPHSNKTDKASMLDEAIEYLKALQLQVQMMWMGRGMPIMALPGAHQYFSHLGLGLSSSPSVTGPFQVTNQSIQSPSMLCNSPNSDPVMTLTQMPSPAYPPELYAWFFDLQKWRFPDQSDKIANPLVAKIDPRDPRLTANGSR